MSSPFRTSHRSGSPCGAQWRPADSGRHCANPARETEDIIARLVLRLPRPQLPPEHAQAVPAPPLSLSRWLPRAQERQLAPTTSSQPLESPTANLQLPTLLCRITSSWQRLRTFQLVISPPAPWMTGTRAM